MITRAAAVGLLPLVGLLVLSSACSSPVVPANDEPDLGSPGERQNPTGAAPDSGTPGAPAINPGNDPSVVDLGEVTAGSTVTFDVPQGTIGFTIVLGATVTDRVSLGVESLDNPSGAHVVTDFADVNEAAHRLTGQSGSGVGILPFPLVNNHALDPVPVGKWTAKVGGFSITGGSKSSKGTTTPFTGKLHAIVRFQTTTDGAFHAGALDLDIYVPDGLGLQDTGAAHTITAATAAADVDLQSRLTIAFGLFKRLYGLDKGDVRYHAVAASVKAITSQDGVNAANVLATFASQRPAAQIILTNQLSPDGPDGGEISGVSNCLPGAVGVPGTICSGVIVSLRPSTPAWQDASTLVHELGHFIGLEHTTEFDGYADTLSDTPACTNLAKNQLASCPDHDNLMFPTSNLATSEPSIAVSPMQRALVRASALYRKTP